jgi:hypothetical protein
VSDAGGPDWSAAELAAGLRQPDQRSCGATVLVVARMLLDHGYAELLGSGRHPGTGFALPGSLATRFRHEVLAMHQRVTGPVDADGHLQVPWPRALGTPPWAVAHQMSSTGGALPRVAHGVHATWLDRGAVFDRIVAATATGRPVPVYVGNRWAPRHVVLFLGLGPGGDADALRCYEPAGGRLVDVDRGSFVAARLGLAGWDRPWFTVLPEPPARALTARRTPA